MIKDHNDSTEMTAEDKTMILERLYYSKYSMHTTRNIRKQFKIV